MSPPVRPHGEDPRRPLGAAGERLAQRTLEAKGYRIIGRNIRLKSGEIDIVAEEDGCLVLIEVRLRRGATAGEALESVGGRKQARLRRLAAEFRAGLVQQPECMRIDVVAVSLDRGGRLGELLVVKNAIEDQ